MFHKACKNEYGEYSLNGDKFYRNNYRVKLTYNSERAKNISLIKNNQEQDLYIIHVVSELIFGKINVDWEYESEHRTYIPDLAAVRYGYKVSDNPSLQQCYFDHIVYYKNVPFIIESDDPSHYDKNYCLRKGWDYQDIQNRDEIKNTWCEQMGFKLIRLKANQSIEERAKQLYSIFKLYKPLIDENL